MKSSFKMNSGANSTEELEQFAQRMRDYAENQGINSGVYEPIINAVVRTDNSILFHRSPQNWIDRNLEFMRPITKYPV